MADLPRLPDGVRRKIALQWDALVEKHGFTGEHLSWSKTRKVKIVTDASPPAATLDSRTTRFIRTRTGLTRPIYAHADTIGISETGRLAVERFAQLAGEYFSLWAVEQGRRSDVFAGLLDEIRSVAADEVAQLWKERGDWFQRICRASLDTTLAPTIGQWTRRARDIEIQDLEAQQLKLDMAEAQQKIARLDAIAEEVSEMALAQPASAASSDNTLKLPIALVRHGSVGTRRIGSQIVIQLLKNGSIGNRSSKGPDPS